MTQEVIHWTSAGYTVRQAVVELCGWANKGGTATPTGKRIARSAWAELSPAAKTVLLAHGIEQ